MARSIIGNKIAPNRNRVHWLRRHLACTVDGRRTGIALDDAPGSRYLGTVIVGQIALALRPFAGVAASLGMRAQEFTRIASASRRSPSMRSTLAPLSFAFGHVVIRRARILRVDGRPKEAITMSRAGRM